MFVILAVALDDIVHIGRALRQVLVHVGNEGITRARGYSRVMLALKANGRASFRIHAAPTERTGHVGRVDLHAVIKLEQTIKDAVVERVGPLFASDGKVGAGYIADEERIAGQHQPGVVAPARIGDREGDMLRAMAGRMDDAQAHDAKSQFAAVTRRPFFAVTSRISSTISTRGSTTAHTPAVVQPTM